MEEFRLSSTYSLVIRSLFAVLFIIGLPVVLLLVSEYQETRTQATNVKPIPSVTRIPSPTFSLTRPFPGIKIILPPDVSQAVAGSALSIQAELSDTRSIQKVEFLLNASSICEDTTLPYMCWGHVPNKQSVSYTITVRAYDEIGMVNSQTTIVNTNSVIH